MALRNVWELPGNWQNSFNVGKKVSQKIDRAWICAQNFGALRLKILGAWRALTANIKKNQKLLGLAKKALEIEICRLPEKFTLRNRKYWNAEMLKCWNANWAKCYVWNLLKTSKIVWKLKIGGFWIWTRAIFWEAYLTLRTKKMLKCNKCYVWNFLKLLWDGPGGSIYPSLRVRPWLKVIWGAFEAKQKSKILKFDWKFPGCLESLHFAT